MAGSRRPSEVQSSAAAGEEEAVQSPMRTKRGHIVKNCRSQGGKPNCYGLTAPDEARNGEIGPPLPRGERAGKSLPFAPHHLPSENSARSQISRAAGTLSTSPQNARTEKCLQKESARRARGRTPGPGRRAKSCHAADAEEDRFSNVFPRQSR
nr:hypothetical protein CFP56_19349 [Quercus suber]